MSTEIKDLKKQVKALVIKDFTWMYFKVALLFIISAIISVYSFPTYFAAPLFLAGHYLAGGLLLTKWWSLLCSVLTVVRLIEYAVVYKTLDILDDTAKLDNKE